MEIAPDGSGYRIQTRFSRFVNVPELMNIFKMRTDIQTAKMLKLPTPKLRNGAPTVVSCSPCEHLKKLTAELVERSEAIRGGRVHPSKDNMLKVTSAGRMAALDMRLINRLLPANPEGKLAKLCANVVRIRKETDARKGTQLIFSDLGTPNGLDWSRRPCDSQTPLRPRHRRR